MNHSNKLKITTPSDREIVMTREFNAPRRLVWDAMTKPELMRKWLFLPPGWTMSRCEEDVRVGGSFTWAWNGPDGRQVMAMHGVYREVSPPAGSAGGKLVRTEVFDMGCPAQAGEQVATMTMTERGGTTLVTISVLYPSKEARDGAACSGMEQGMGIGYDNLEKMLESEAAGAGR